MAALLRTKLPLLDNWNVRRRALAAQYSANLEGSGLAPQHVPEWAEPVWHLYVVRSAQRQQLQEGLAARGIQTIIHYPVPPHLQPAYAELKLEQGRFPISEAIHAEVLSLPFWPQMQDSQQAEVAAACRQLCTGAGAADQAA